jgi:acyl-CoA reductase-like NAD-dependent aldehyde dehydrogenase
VCGYVEEGLKREARVVIGGLPPKQGPLSEGYYAIPTVFANVANDWRLAREEIFGPGSSPFLGPMRPTRSAWLTTATMGLLPTFGRTTGRALRAAHAIEAGWVQVNQGLGQSPGHSYGGYKESGIGREFSLEGMLESYTQRKNVTVNLTH